MQTIGITGGTGFIGQHLTSLLKSHGNHVVIFTRNPDLESKDTQIEYSFWDPENNKCDLSALHKLDAVVHLSGANLASKRWTKKRKKDILESRVNGTKFIIAQLKINAPNCKTFIAASAIGYYGNDKDKPFVETDPPGNDFLAQTCVKWEMESAAADNFLRTVIFRFGVVFGKDDGAFPQLVKPLSFGIVPVPGTGKQVMSWIHIEDLTELIRFAIGNNDIKGVYNAVSKEPVTQKDLMQLIKKQKGGLKLRLTVPKPALKLALGELGGELLKSCTVNGQKIEDAGFRLKYPGVKETVRELVV